MVTHTESMDMLATLKAVGPGMIHGLDSTLLRCALGHLRDVPITAVHDAVGGLPNSMDMVTEKLRDAFLMATPEGYLQSIADEWGVGLKIPVNANNEWRKGIHQALNMFN
jgi:DNA-directed RNA polymerase